VREGRLANISEDIWQKRETNEIRHQDYLPRKKKGHTLLPSSTTEKQRQ
jgi:hypothetical protein